MPILTKKPSPKRTKSPKVVAVEQPLLLYTREEVQAYLAAHLTPVRYTPKGQPIYAHEEVEKLNVRLFADS